jgi:hypothetical protein
MWRSWKLYTSARMSYRLTPYREEFLRDTNGTVLTSLHQPKDLATNKVGNPMLALFRPSEVNTTSRNASDMSNRYLSIRKPMICAKPHQIPS